MDANLNSPMGLTLDMVYHPDLANTWHFYQYIIFILSTFMVSLTSYIVLKKSSPEMGIYKLLLLNQLIWSYLFDIALTFWQPVNLVPFFICYSTGIAKFFGPNSVYSMFIIACFSYCGLMQSIIVALLFRVSRLYTSTGFLYENKINWIKIGVVVLVILEVFAFMPVFIWMLTPDTGVETVRRNVIQADPIMAKVFELEPSSNGLDWTQSQYVLIIGCIDYGIFLFIFTSILIFSSFIFVKRMKFLQTSSSLHTFRLQVMLFKTLVVQTLLILITIAMPILVLVFMLLFKTSNGSFYMQIVLFPLSIHALVDTFTMLYFINIYRSYVNKKIKRLFTCVSGLFNHNISVNNITKF